MRIDKGLTQMDIAHVLNMSTKAFRMIEKEKKQITFEQFKKLKDLIGLNNSMFLGARHLEICEEYIFKLVHTTPGIRQAVLKLLDINWPETEHFEFSVIAA